MKKIPESIEPMRVALFVYYGWLSFSPSLDSAIRLLVKEGYHVDVVYKYDEKYGTFEPNIKKVRLLAVKPCKRNYFTSLKYLINSLKFTINYEYDFLIGVDWGGVIVAGIMTMINNIPYVYYSLELLLKEDIQKQQYIQRMLFRFIKVIESYYIRKASLIIIQDEYRKAVLINDANIRHKDRIVMVPNAYYFEGEKNKKHIKGTFNFPKGKKIVLYAGSIIPEMAIKEIIDQIKTWPNDILFLLHTFFINDYLKDIEQLIKANNLGDKIWISLRRLSFEELCSLIGRAHIGISFNKPGNKNGELTPSGKVSFYLSQGIPIIINNIPPQYVDLVLKYNCGIVVNNPNEVGDAIKTILENYQRMSINAKECYKEELEFSKYFRRVLRQLDFLRK